MRFGHVQVVRLNRDGVENRCDESLAPMPPPPLGQLNADTQLRHGNRRHRDVVVVVDRFTQRIATALGVN